MRYFRLAGTQIRPVFINFSETLCYLSLTVLLTLKFKHEKKGLNGGKILDLTLTEDDELIYRFANGEATECANKDAEIALCIMMYSYN
jgi:hypothetical protein